MRTYLIPLCLLSMLALACNAPSAGARQGGQDDALCDHGGGGRDK
jgi:hypothetical protein